MCCDLKIFKIITNNFNVVRWPFLLAHGTPSTRSIDVDLQAAITVIYTKVGRQARESALHTQKKRCEKHRRWIAHNPRRQNTR